MAWDLTAVLRLKDDMSGKMRKINEQMDTLNRMSGETASTVVRFANALPAVTAGAAVATAALAPMVVTAGGLAASLAAAGAGAVAFGVVATSVLTDVFEAAEELDKINEKIAQADTAKERLAAEKELAALYEGMSKSQAGALKELQEFKSFWGEFKKEFEDPIFDAFSEGLKFTKSLLNALKPTIESVSGAVNVIMRDLNASFDNPEMKSFFTWLEENAAGSLINFAKVAGNTFLGFSNLMQTFAPFGVEVENSLVGMTERFREWSATLSESQGFKNFIAYAQQNGPILSQLFSNLAAIFGQTVVALAPIGTTLLQGLTDFTGYIRENFSTIAPIVGTVIAAFAGFQILVGIMTVVRGAIAVFGILKNTFGILTKTVGFVKNAFTLLRLSMLLFPGGWIIAAIGAVIAGGVALYKNWDTVRAATTKLWDKLGAFKGVATAVLGPIGFIIRAAVDLAENWDSTRSVWENVWGAITRTAANAANEVIGSVNAIIEKINAIPGIDIPSIPTVGGGGSGGTDGSHYHGLSNVPYNGYTANLHKGERVLTAAENKEYTNGAGRSVVNLTFHYNGGQKLDEQEMERLGGFIVRKVSAAVEGGA